MKKIAVYLSASPEGGGFFQYAEFALETVAGLRPVCPVEIRCWYGNEHWQPILKRLGLPGQPVKRPTGFVRRLRTSLMKRFIRLFYGRNSLLRQKTAAANLQIADWQPDLVVSAQPAFFILPGAVPHIAPVHDLMHLFETEFPEVGTAKKIASRNRLYAGMARYCTKILVDSALGKEHMIKHFSASAGQIEVVPYAAPQALLDLTPQKPQRPLPERFLFYPAQFWQHKNHVRLLAALDRVKKTHPDIHCVFSGSTSHQGYAPFMETAHQLGLAQNVTVLGYVSTGEVSWLYRHARGLVMPTFFGPTNIPPLEAMALACPVAVSDIYAMREQCGEAALYFDPRDTEDMASAISLLWTDGQTRSRLVEKGLAHHENWNAGHMKRAFTNILREQLEQG